MKKQTSDDNSPLVIAQHRAARLLRYSGFRAAISGQANHDAICVGYAHAAIHGAGLLLTGNAGTGKTLAAKSLFAKSHHIRKERDDAGLPCQQVYLFELHSGEHLTRLDNWEPTEGRTENVLLDDVGVEEIAVDYGQRRDTVASFINRWYAWRTADKVGQIVITTNLTGRQLVDRYGSRSIDRLMELCVTVALEGKSRRQTLPVFAVRDGKLDQVAGRA